MCQTTGGLRYSQYVRYSDKTFKMAISLNQFQHRIQFFFLCTTVYANCHFEFFNGQDHKPNTEHVQFLSPHCTCPYKPGLQTLNCTQSYYVRFLWLNNFFINKWSSLVLVQLFISSKQIYWMHDFHV